MVLWVGQQLSADFITKVFGAASHSQINTEMVSQRLAVFSFSGLPTAACICTVAESCSGRTGVEVSLKDDCVCTSNVVQFCLPFSFSLSLSIPVFLLPPSLQHALPALDNTLSFRVRGILARLQNRRQFSMRVSCCTLRGIIPSECLSSSRVHSLSLSHTHTHTHAHAHTCTHTHTHTHTCTRTHMHTHTHTRMHTHTHTHTRTHMHTHTHAHAHTCTHTHTHTHTHTCTQLFVTKQRDKTEVIFRRMLKEDKGAGQWEGTSYIDFLCQVHRDIKEILS